MAEEGRLCTADLQSVRQSVSPVCLSVCCQSVSQPVSQSVIRQSDCSTLEG